MQTIYVTELTKLAFHQHTKNLKLNGKVGQNDKIWEIMYYYYYLELLIKRCLRFDQFNLFFQGI